MYICGRGKDDDDYITGANMKNDASYKTWFSENNMIMSWLTNSMAQARRSSSTRQQKKSRMQSKRRFQTTKNAIEVFEIKSQFLELRQGDLNVTQYFSILS